PKGQLPSGLESGLLKHFGQWDSLPVVFALDINTRRQTPICIGYSPSISPSGEMLLVRDLDNNWRRIELGTLRGEDVRLPGNSGGVIEFLTDDLVLYWIYPTEGAALKMTENNSPLRGAKPMESLKVGQLRTGRFQTVAPYVDPRRRVS